MTPPAFDPPILLALLGGGFATAFLHAALPTHWLPFVLVGRAQRSSRSTDQPARASTVNTDMPSTVPAAKATVRPPSTSSPSVAWDR